MAELIRLQLARESLGLSSAELAERAGVNESTITSYESRHNARLDAAALWDLGEALGISGSFLASDDPVPEVTPISDAYERLDAADQTRLLAQARLAYASASKLSALMDEHMSGMNIHWADPPNVPYAAESARDASEFADMLREGWALGGETLPPLASLLEDRGVIVALADVPGEFEACAFVGEDDAHMPLIMIQHDLSGAAQRFALAREVAFFLLDQPNHQLATHFAGAFLLNDEQLRRDMGEQRTGIDAMELRLLAARYGVTLRTLIARAATLRIIDREMFESWGEAIAAIDPEEAAALAEDVAPEMPTRLLRLGLMLSAEGLVDEDDISDLLDLPWLAEED